MADSIAHYLKSEWLKLFEGALVDANLVDSYFIQILTAYSEPHRFYHRPEHLHHMIGLLHEAQVSNSSVLLAAFYHDYIYTPGNNDNEIKSAKIAKEQLTKLGVTDALISRVCELILATQHHDLGQGDNITAAFLDADMSVLGVSTPAYVEYVIRIKHEFSKVPRFFFNRGRKKFLSALLSQERIFMTDWFYEKFEAQARVNIAKEFENF